MKISVLMCNFNYGEFIGQAIESVLKQTYADFELIVVDDGSTDHSREVIDSFSDKRIVRIFKENGGQASAFNAGFLESKGDLICFLDSDDWWANDKLEAVLKWDDYLNSNYSILQHAVTVSEEDLTCPYKFTLPSGDCFAEMCETGKIDYFVPTSGLTIPSKVCEKVFPLPQTLRICADAYLTRTCIAFGQVVSIPSSHGFYRKHKNTVYKNKEFSVQIFFNDLLFPLLEEFYFKNGIKVPPFKKRKHIFLNRLFRFLPAKFYDK